MGYVKIKRGTEEWDRIYKVFNFQKKWTDKREEIESFLGFEMEDNLFLDVEHLVVSEKAIRKYRPEWLPYFKKDFTAKVKSKLHKEWLELIEKLGLEVYSLTKDFTWSLNTPFGSIKSAYRIEDDYYLKVDESKFRFEGNDWAIPVKESDFLRMQADQLDKEHDR